MYLVLRRTCLLYTSTSSAQKSDMYSKSQGIALGHPAFFRVGWLFTYLVTERVFMKRTSSTENPNLLQKGRHVCNNQVLQVGN